MINNCGRFWGVSRGQASPSSGKDYSGPDGKVANSLVSLIK